MVRLDGKASALGPRTPRYFNTGKFFMAEWLKTSFAVGVTISPSVVKRMELSSSEKPGTSMISCMPPPSSSRALLAENTGFHKGPATSSTTPKMELGPLVVSSKRPSGSWMSASVRLRWLQTSLSQQGSVASQARESLVASEGLLRSMYSVGLFKRWRHRVIRGSGADVGLGQLRLPDMQGKARQGAKHRP